MCRRDPLSWGERVGVRGLPRTQPDLRPRSNCEDLLPLSAKTGEFGEPTLGFVSTAVLHPLLGTLAKPRLDIASAAALNPSPSGDLCKTP